MDKISRKCLKKLILMNLVLFLGVSLSRHRVQADAHEGIQHLHDRRYVSLVEMKNSF